MFDAYRARTQQDGLTHEDGLVASTKRQVHNYIQSSPSKSIVEIFNIGKGLTDEYELISHGLKTTIVSDKETFYKRTILFEPDEVVDIGSYIKHDKRFYLMTEGSDVEIYPAGFLEFCNYTIKVPIGATVEIENGKDERDRPKYKYITPTMNIPAVVSSKIYSVLDNSQVPLPEGALMVKIPYHSTVTLKVNDILEVFGDETKVTTIAKESLLINDNNEYYGFYTIRCQKVTKT